ncbi:MAG: hypothetical protein ACLSAH_22980 [Bilophila wadsworthia]
MDLPIPPDVLGCSRGRLCPPVAADECLRCSPPCIDAWWQSGGVGEPMEPGCTTGRLSPCRRAQPAAQASPPALGTRSSAPTTGPTSRSRPARLRRWGPRPSPVRSGGPITLDAPRIVIKGLLSMQSQGGGATTATLAGSLNATGDVTASNISLNSHTHPGDSGGTTGGPQ